MTSRRQKEHREKTVTEDILVSVKNLLSTTDGQQWDWTPLEEVCSLSPLTGVMQPESGHAIWSTMFWRKLPHWEGVSTK